MHCCLFEMKQLKSFFKKNSFLFVLVISHCGIDQVPLGNNFLIGTSSGKSCICLLFSLFVWWEISNVIGFQNTLYLRRKSAANVYIDIFSLMI